MKANESMPGFTNNRFTKNGVIVHSLVIAFCSFGMTSVMANTSGSPSPEEFSHMSLEDLTNIEVTSVSKSKERLLDAPAAVTVITGEDIRRSGASSIPEALRLADNLNVAQKNSHDWAISSRGFNTDLADKLLVMIDGRTVYTPLFSGTFWDRQDYLLEDIDRIEVISGPGGTLWGANAVNGVINIISKSSAATQGTYLEASAGSQLRASTGVRYGGKLAPDVSFRVYGKYFNRDDEQFSTGKEASDSWNMTQGGFRIDGNASPQSKFTLQGDYYNGNENIPTSPGMDASGVTGGNILGRWTQTLANDSSMSLQAYYDQTHFSLPKPTNGFAASGYFVEDLDTYDLDFQYSFRFNERNKIIWGLGYRFTHDNVQNSPTVGVTPAQLDQSRYSGFIQDEIKLQDKLALTVGTKLEHNDFTGFEVEPSARLQWSFATDQMLWAAVSRAVRTPSRLDRGLITPTNLPPPGPANILAGDPDYFSETVVAYEVGYRAQLNPKVFTSVSTFYNVYDHVRSTSAGPPASLGLPIVFHNNLEGETYGVEFSTNYQALEWWRLHFGYSLLQEDIRSKAGIVDFTNATNETADPQQQVSLRSSMNLPRNLELDANLRWVDRLHNNSGATVGVVPSYAQLDVRVGWHPTKQVEVSLVGQSLLNDHHREFGFPDATQEEIERSVFGKVQWNF